MRHLAIVPIVLASAVACSGGDTPADDDDTAPPLPPASPDTGDGMSASAVTGSGAIDSPFNGYRLSSSTRRDGAGAFRSRTFHALDVAARTITLSIVSEEDATVDETDRRETIELNTAGLPAAVEFFDVRGAPQAIESFDYDAGGRLASRTVRVESDDRETRVEYDYDAAGRPLTERSVDPESGGGLSRTDYTYGADGLLIESVSYFPFFSPIETTRYEHDSRDRLSGWTKSNRLSGQASGATFTWDENGNVSLFEVFDEAGALTRSVAFEYVRVDETVYNVVLYDYIYGPGGF